LFCATGSSALTSGVCFLADTGEVKYRVGRFTVPDPGSGILRLAHMEPFREHLGMIRLQALS